MRPKFVTGALLIVNANNYCARTIVFRFIVIQYCNKFSCQNQSEKLVSWEMPTLCTLVKFCICGHSYVPVRV